MTFTLEINRWQEIMALLYKNEGKNISKINHDIFMTYSHTSKIIAELERRKLVEKKEVGRQIQVYLTIEGKKIAEYCRNIDDYLSRGDKNERIHL